MRTVTQTHSLQVWALFAERGQRLWVAQPPAGQLERACLFGEQRPDRAHVQSILSHQTGEQALHHGRRQVRRERLAVGGQLVGDGTHTQVGEACRTGERRIVGTLCLSRKRTTSRLRQLRTGTQGRARSRRSRSSSSSSSRSRSRSSSQTRGSGCHRRAARAGGDYIGSTHVHLKSIVVSYLLLIHHGHHGLLASLVTIRALAHALLLIHIDILFGVGVLRGGHRGAALLSRDVRREWRLLRVATAAAGRRCRMIGREGIGGTRSGGLADDADRCCRGDRSETCARLHTIAERRVAPSGCGTGQLSGVQLCTAHAQIGTTAAVRRLGGPVHRTFGLITTRV
mmetsp:Transcript_35560/g.89345  ORF Transcript_35560/g.89345 Transcript_35560/m.89345 type:complete len:341 (-) Transcript_35560:1670-2692(-)